MARGSRKHTGAQQVPTTLVNTAAFMLRIWMTRGTVAKLLWPLSQLFRLLVAARRYAYKKGLLTTIQLPVPVIIVGNLFIGGTGKTPLTIWLAEQLQQAGYRPGVISRGYGGKHVGTRHVWPESSPSDVGDEPALIAQRTACPVTVGADRVAAGQALLAAHPETNVIIADDGLQHYRLGRDIEIVLGDARGAGNGWLLPAGPLREPVSRSCDFNVVNKGSLVRSPHRDTPGLSTSKSVVSMYLQVLEAERLQDRTCRWPLAAIATTVPMPVIVAGAGMGNPARFFDSLTSAGLVFDRLPLPDHHVFTAATFSGCHADIILITEKDAVKCREVGALLSDTRIWVVPVTACIDHSFADNILERLRGSATA